MVQRNIVTCIILSIVTCGIYSIYWYYCVAEDIHRVKSDALPTTPVLTIVLIIVTCGIYAIYAFYQWGKAVTQYAAEKGVTIEDKSILYLILAIFSLSIINMALIQGDLNLLASQNGQ